MINPQDNLFEYLSNFVHVVTHSEKNFVETLPIRRIADQFRPILSEVPIPTEGPRASFVRLLVSEMERLCAGWEGAKTKEEWLFSLWVGSNLLLDALDSDQWVRRFPLHANTKRPPI